MTYFRDTSVPIVAQILIACDNCDKHVPSVLTLVLSNCQALLLGEFECDLIVIIQRSGVLYVNVSPSSSWPG